jgi:hypothetical protein
MFSKSVVSLMLTAVPCEPLPFVGGRARGQSPSPFAARFVSKRRRCGSLPADLNEAKRFLAS